MEFIAIVLLIAILVILITLRNQFSERLLRMELDIRRIQELLTKSVIAKKAAEPEKPVTAAASAPSPAPEAWQSGFKIEKEEENISHTIPPAGVANKETATPAEAEFFVRPTPVSQKPAESQSPPVSQQLWPAPKPGFFERHPDLEKFIGENLVSKIGIAVLVLAIAFFVKYAIDNNWINPAGRVGIGLLCGGILVAFGHFTRNNYKAFSSVLVGGGLAVFYFTIALAYHQFGLFSQTASFIIMVVITGFAVILSSMYNRQELAIIALAGGFATPFMVSNGNSDYTTLFIYLIVLNLGLLVLAYKKAWRMLNLLAFLFTVILFAGWIFTLDENEAAITYRNAFIFATIFYLLFFVINIAHNIKEQKKFIASDFGILLANTGLYFGTGLFCLGEIYADAFSGFFCIAMGAFNLGASYMFFRKNKVDGNILYLLIGITLTFISLTAPIQLNGNNITLFWATEAVLLYWLYQKSGISIVRISSFIIWTCMLISLVMDWNAVYADTSVSLTLIANKGFITTLCAAISSGLLFILRRKDHAQEKAVQYNWLPSATIYLIVSLILFFLAGFLEINHQFRNHYPSIQIYILYLLLYTLIFIAIVKFASVKEPFSHIHPGIITGILLFGIILYLVSVPSGYSVQRQMLEQRAYGSHYIVHWLNDLLTGIIIYQLYRRVRGMKDTEIPTWLLCGVIVIFLTVETQLIADAIFFSPANTLSEIQRIFIKTGWTILWSICSFVFMWLGMRNKFRTLRIVSLTLFTITLIKLFIYDIRNMPVGGKIAAFFSLGVLLLVVSFMYQRLKKIIIDNEEKLVD